METVKYITSLFTFYLKGEISSEQNFVRFKVPNTILGLIPLGAKKDNVAINQISSTQTNFKLKFGKFLVGAIIAALGFSMMEDSLALSLILFLIAANSIIDAFEIDLQVNMTSGQTKVIDFFIFDKGKAEAAERQINMMISNRLDDTNNRQQTDRIVDAIQNK